MIIYHISISYRYFKKKVSVKQFFIINTQMFQRKWTLQLQMYVLRTYTFASQHEIVWSAYLYFCTYYLRLHFHRFVEPLFQHDLMFLGHIVTFRQNQQKTLVGTYFATMKR